jgi:hypothetical protein
MFVAEVLDLPGVVSQGFDRVRDIKVEIKLPGVPPSSLRIGR